MKKRELRNLGVPDGEAMKVAFQCLGRAAQARMKHDAVAAAIRGVVADPAAYAQDAVWAGLAGALTRTATARARYADRVEPAPYRRWGEGLDAKSIEQMDNACRLPISVCGALMPDAHMGYGLPIGGVLAVKDAVIPYAVGMDIACRMKMTVLDLPVSAIRGQEGRLRNAIADETCFGVGAGFRRRKDHAVMDRDWSVSPITQRNRDKAWKQLGSSGSGNHFVEFGTLTLDQDDLGLKAGVYVALLSHSGSRGTGGNVAQYYSKLAMERHRELPRQLLHLAWFDLAGAEGQEYWQAMELMGGYAAANHELIHRGIAKNLGANVLLDIENHHNFAWKENHFGEDVIVHRKGATPAGAGVLGIIPGSMATPGYVARGKGHPESLNSASHGAGRAMSRTAAKNSFTWSEAKKVLAARDVVLISAGLDEVPMSYKDIHAVMAAQRDLVQIVARFDPKLVKMAPEGERPED
ncbi:MAG: RtcB family protein [Kiritimatiellae bacterium]|nr:RtcB family protein [Kiritimatiellia bacterium]